IWAVGDLVSQTLVLHWDGSSWSIVPSPSPGSSNYLRGVAAVSSNDVWAVGDYSGGTLVLHWNGAKWSIVPSPGTAQLKRVAVVAANDVWAVGNYYNNGVQTQIEHWDGSS